MNLTTLRGDISFWDAFAPWYEKWLSRGSYHGVIIKELSKMLEQGWRVLDIGAATGVISIPMAALGCSVKALEPSSGMRQLFKKKLAALEDIPVEIVSERWESYRPDTSDPHDLIVACNSLHLTHGGIKRGMEKVFGQNAAFVCLVTEINLDMFIDFREIHTMQNDYDFLFIKEFTLDSSFHFEELEEVMELSMALNRQIPVETVNDAIVNRSSTDIAILLWERR
ncbi:MAG: class I SAM-dependent methyltransferase [Dissulfurispiraceae bacterium]